MYKLTLFVFCLAVLALGGGFTGLGMALGALGFVLGALAIAHTVWQLLTA